MAAWPSGSCSLSIHCALHLVLGVAPEEWVGTGPNQGKDSWVRLCQVSFHYSVEKSNNNHTYF